ncbi:hypothetical protein BMONG18_1609 [Bifidobacterium mongoliense]|uniref:Uncharacterized protein n=1 Tax=Bifidobacterium mongoliense TaxID=518643 RepID=A0A423UC47_9BIFI|nr:hypothetical protein BMONG18_1609 [Bifidobacterium mongoliense]
MMTRMMKKTVVICPKVTGSNSESTSGTATSALTPRPQQANSAVPMASTLMPAANNTERRPQCDACPVFNCCDPSCVVGVVGKGRSD